MTQEELIQKAANRIPDGGYSLRELIITTEMYIFGYYDAMKENKQ